MAPQQQQTVNFTEHSPFKISDPDELMTLGQASTGLLIPVYVSASPFIVEDEVLRNLVDNVATLTPQPLSIIIDEDAHNQTPDLMWSIQAYCAYHSETMILDTLEIASLHPEASAQLSATATVLLEAGDVVVVFGSEKLLNSVIDATLKLTSKTIIYIPANIEDQFELHQLLHVKHHCSVIPIVSVDVLDTADTQQCQVAILKVVELALTGNADLMQWLEGNVSILTTMNAATLLDLLSRHLSTATSARQHLLFCDTDAISSLVTASNDQLTVTDAIAMLMAINSRAMVIAEHLPEGTDRRVCALLRSLGFSLHFDGLFEQSAKLSLQLFNSYKLVAPIKRDATSPASNLTVSHYRAAISWLDRPYQNSPA